MCQLEHRVKWYHPIFFPERPRYVPQQSHELFGVDSEFTFNFFLSPTRRKVFVFVCTHSVMSNSFMGPWTITRQAPLSMRFPSKNAEPNCHSLLQGIFPTQRLNPHLLHWQVDSLPLSHLRNPFQEGINYKLGIYSSEMLF